MKRYKLSIALTAAAAGLAVTMALPALAGSSHDNHHGGCQHLFLRPEQDPTMPTITVRGSGQDGDLRELQVEAAQEIYRVARELGLSIPDSNITFLAAGDMASIAMVNGHPAPHFSDGEAIVQGVKQAGGILEVVMPGTFHQQFVRDTNSIDETRMVFAHVAGHYDFAENASSAQVSSPDPVKTSLALSDFMSKMIEKAGYKEVMLFYQYLLTLDMLQDIFRGTYDPPSTFVPDTSTRVGPQKPFPARPSRSVLQALSVNLPVTAPDWQREMLRLYEANRRSRPFYYLNKIANEGWSTFLMPIILSHTRWSTSQDAVANAQIMSGVRHADLGNPYWLGSEAWWRLYENFRKRPENRGLSAWDLDRKFIAYAHEIIRNETDFSFLQLALDDEWLRKQEAFLGRTLKVERNWMTGEVEKVTKQAVSTDPARIKRWLANRLANRELHFPKIEVVNLNYRGSGEILLRHAPVEGIPLRRQTLAKALYVVSQVMGRTVTIETIGTEYWRPEQLDLRPFKILVTATPTGEIRVRAEKNEDESRLPPGFEAALQASVDAFRADVDLTYPDSVMNPGKTGERASIITAMTGGEPGSIAATQFASGVSTVTTHSPKAADAILEYLRVSAYRLEEQVRRALRGDGGSIRFPPGGRTARVTGVLPEIPKFELDQQIREKKKKRMKPSPVDGQPRPPSGDGPQDEPGIADDDLEIMGGPHVPGDIWDEKPQPGSGGKGEGKGKGQPGDEEGDPESPADDSDGEHPDKPGGTGGGNPTFEDLPIELYGKILAQELELPNLRPVAGDDMKDEDTIRFGGEHKPTGVTLWDRTAEEIIERGLAMARTEGKDPYALTFNEIYALGLKYMTPDMHVTSSEEPDPEPKNRAVIVWIMDVSGSMSEEYRRLMRTLVANERAAMKATYPEVQEVFILYSDQAQEVSEKEFMGTRRGGGNDVAKAMDLTENVLNTRFPKQRFNQFVRIFSDGGEYVATALPSTERMTTLVDFTGYTHIDPRGVPMDSGSAAMSVQFQKLAEERPNVGFGILQPGFASVVENLKALYGPKKPKR